MTESSVKSAYYLKSYAPMEFEPGPTRNRGVAIYVHESLCPKPLELSIQTDSIPELNYTGVEICITKNNLNTPLHVYTIHNPKMNKNFWSV